MIRIDNLTKNFGDLEVLVVSGLLTIRREPSWD